MKNSKIILALLAGVTSTFLWSGCSTTSTSQTASDDANVYNTRYRSDFEVPLGDHYTGRSPYLRSQTEIAPAAPAAPAPAAPRAAAARPAAKQTCAEINTGMMQMTKTMPAEAALGQEFMYELKPTALGCVGNVVVSDHVPTGASYVRSEPAATVEGEHLVWKFHSMEPGESHPIKVWLKADKEGTLSSCATLAADPRVCSQTFVGKPALSIQKTGPEVAQLGTDVTYNIVVRNTGSAVARKVIVTDDVPAGLASATGGKQLSFDFGDLAPNQAKTVPVVLKAAERGKHCNSATATSSNAGKVTAEACTTVVKPGLKIVKTGDKEQYINRNAKYKITVSNTGDTTLTGVVVTDTAPAPTTIVSADGATVTGNNATWNVGSLKAGEEKSFNVTLTSKAAGNYCNGASVTTAEKLSDSAQSCTVWKGLSALLLEKGDNPDPIQVGETTTYYVRVTNQGTADDTNVKLVVEFDPELTPVSADNGGRVEGKTVTFPAYPRLAPKQAFEFRIVAKGVKVGDARVKFIRTSDDIKEPTTAEESTRVY